MPLVESFCCLCFPEEGLVRPYREAPGLVDRLSYPSGTSKGLAGLTEQHVSDSWSDTPRVPQLFQHWLEAVGCGVLWNTAQSWCHRKSSLGFLLVAKDWQVSSLWQRGQSSRMQWVRRWLGSSRSPSSAHSEAKLPVGMALTPLGQFMLWKFPLTPSKGSRIVFKKKFLPLLWASFSTSVNWQ